MPRNERRPADDPRRRFEALFTQHYPAVLAYARRRAPDEAADVVGEVFLTAWRRFDDVPPDPLPWLLGVARRVLANARRASARRAALVAEPAIERDHAWEVAERDAVAAAFASLSEEDREVLMLVAWDGLAPTRAVRVLECSVATFYVRLHRARRRLAEAIEAGEGSPSETEERTR